MTDFSIDQSTDQPDRIFVEGGGRFNVAIILTEAGLELRVCPRTDGALRDSTLTAWIVDEAEIAALETGMMS
jgi:hypothetical protein